MRPFLVVVFSLGTSLASAADPGRRDPAPVARTIDVDILKQLAARNIKPSPRADDAEFLRRVTLDITGRIPTPERAAAFLDNTSPTKRGQLIDELLASPQYGEHLASIWTELILNSGTPPRTATAAFRQWLAGQFNQGRGWDQIVREMLTSEGTQYEVPSTYLLRANLKEPGQQASTIARFFLGVQIQCAECHNHPFTAWKQTDYWGMAAFFTRLNQVTIKGGSKLSEEPLANKKPPASGTGAVIAIPSGGGNKASGKLVAAKYLGGEQPKMPDTGPLRPAFAAWITARDNPWFAPAAVNRTWAHFFGAGFVNPIDDFQEGTPPSHPELLALLAREFVTSDYDLKYLVRCICNSETYQRTSRPLPENKEDRTLFSHMAVKVLAADVLFDSLVTALGNPKLPGGLGSPLPYEVYAPKATATGRLQAREEFIKFFDTKDDSGRTTDYTHGIPQILALMNAKQFNATPPLVEKLVKANPPREKAIETLCLAALSRRPTADEAKLLADYVARRRDATQGCAGVLWLLFNSAEFVLNH